MKEKVGGGAKNLKWEKEQGILLDGRRWFVPSVQCGNLIQTEMLCKSFIIFSGMLPPFKETRLNTLTLLSLSFHSREMEKNNYLQSCCQEQVPGPYQALENIPFSHPLKVNNLDGFSDSLHFLTWLMSQLYKQTRLLCLLVQLLLALAEGVYKGNSGLCPGKKL